MKKLAIPLITLLLALGAPAAYAGETIVFATAANFPPYNFLNTDGEVQGFEADLMHEMCKRAGLSCDFQPVPRDELIAGLAGGEYDAILSAMELPEKKDNGDGGAIAYSRPYLPAMPAAMLVSADSQMPARGASVAVLSGSRAARWVAEKGWSAVGYDDPVQAIEDVELGEVAGFVADQAYLQGIATKRPDTVAIAARGLDAEGPLAVALAGNASGLQGVINATLSQMKRDGTIATLSAKWFAPSTDDQTQADGMGEKSGG